MHADLIATVLGWLLRALADTACMRQKPGLIG
jgi:hypothetical protein